MDEILQQLPLTQKKQTWANLQGSSLSHALALYCEKTSGIKTLITTGSLAAAQLEKSLHFFGVGEQPILMFPDWETLPYDPFSPHQDLISARLNVLHGLLQTSKAVVITTINSLMHRLCPPSHLTRFGLMLHKGQTLNPEAFKERLVNAGYYPVNQVLEHGEFTMRGAIVDCFPMGSRTPFRIEWFDNEIESLRTFNLETQRTIEAIDAIQILPAHEFPMDETGIAHFRSRFREQFDVDVHQCPLYESISHGQAPAGTEYYLPLFFQETATLFDYLPKDSTLCYVDDIRTQAAVFFEEVTKRYTERQGDRQKPILPPEQVFLNPTACFTIANTFQQLRCLTTPTEKKGTVFHFNTEMPPLLPTSRHSDEPLAKLKAYLQDAQNKRILFVIESAGRQASLLDLFKQHHIHVHAQKNWHTFLATNHPINITIGPLTQGAQWPHAAIVVESQLFANVPTPQQKRDHQKIDPRLIIRDLAELKIGDAVVHLHYGVGRYQGLEYITTNQQTNEFVRLTYQNGDNIYIPVTALQLISRYAGSDPERAPLHQLGSKQWQKEKESAQEKAHDVAVELLEIQAKRGAKAGFSYPIDEAAYRNFAEDFPFEPTVDQQQAIDAIVEDLKAPRPMDRLICGDVGFGKTEVAMRAAFIAANTGKQVCVLVPTTLLATQHYENFKERFNAFPIRVELISRFRTAKETSAVLEALEAGKVDIIIGTHKLLQQTVLFKDLGLLIIDEEHRFGVKQKEVIKSWRTEVDLLTMTATPIPRTLNMAMSGIRDISLIATPPARRLAIKTFWHERDDRLIREAISREIFRGGQVFFLHNQVQTIEQTAANIQMLIPEAKVRVAHGQMPERMLERVMSDFYHQQFNVLICTTIIENGIDIPTANTIIIDRADMFGLAQLHQLRGRVGRSHHQAYAYCLSPNEKVLTADAVKRLEALVSLEDLGAGFVLATQDLEIRGAGDLLGEAQSGHIHSVGFSLYMEMIANAIAAVQSGHIPEDTLASHGPEIELNFSTIIPETTIGDVHVRLILYKRIANATTPDELDTLQIEMIDRFGLLPDTVKRLFRVTALKLLAAELGILHIQASGLQGKIRFSRQPRINAAKLIQRIQQDHLHYQMKSQHELKFIFSSKNTALAPEDQLLTSLEDFLRDITIKNAD